MKKMSRFAGIVGAIYVLVNAIGIATIITKPTDLPLVNSSIVVSSILRICFGVFLVSIFLRFKNEEDKNHASSKVTPDSEEDRQNLKKYRNWIFAYIFIYGFIESSVGWILNDYMAGLTAINLSTMFDLVCNVILLYLAAELLKGKKNILNSVLYVSIAYSIGGAIGGYFEDSLAMLVGSLLMGVYVVYAIKAPVNRKNHRIAHLVLLPLAAILTAALIPLERSHIDKMVKDEVLLEEQFSDASSELSGAYGLFLQREQPSATDIQDVLDGKEKREKKIQQVVASMNAIAIEYKKQAPSIQQQESLERLRHLNGIMQIHQEQGNKVAELMDYSKGLDFKKLTDEQEERIAKLKDEIQEFGDKLTEAQFKLDHANLVY